LLLFLLKIRLTKKFIMTRITQGIFSLLPDLTDEQIKKQIEYCIKRGFAVGVEYTDDPHPRNCYWELWGLPLFDIPNASTILYEVNECRKAHPNMYIKINAFNNTRGIESTAVSFIVQRPANEPGFYLTRQEGRGRNIIYTLQSYAVQSAAEGSRY
jgi:ribulose-bisphosphate carboxylase small chain